MPAKLSPKCQNIDAAIKGLENARNNLQAQLQQAAPGEKSEIIQQIKAIKADIKKNSQTAKKLAEKVKAYNKCIKDHGGLPALDATFKGLATGRLTPPGSFK